ncbi:MAG: TlpA disulfide reductase family protein [Eubacteriales bacterium]|nr:TlpA disulfide reductase family protein [Eubacteriales bacterium]
MKKLTALALSLLMAMTLIALPAQKVLAEETKTEEQTAPAEETMERVNPFTLIETETLDGEVFDAKQLDGKPIIINVWADWCGPCRMEMPTLTKLAEEYKDKIVFLGLLAEGMTVEENALVRDEEKIQLGIEAQEELKIGFPTLIPDELLFSAMYQTQLQAFPTTWFINGEGQFVNIAQGAMNEEQWRMQIEGFLAFLEEKTENQ